MRALILAALILAAWHVKADPVPCGNPDDGDLCELRPSERGVAEFWYLNTERQTSDGTDGRTFRLGDVEVTVIIEVDANGGMERITVLADGYIAWPAEADVIDGEEVTVLIIQDMM